jgi:hypothetical protein
MLKYVLLIKELRAKIDQACRTAEEFTKLYYESLDKRRYVRYVYIYIYIHAYVHMHEFLITFAHFIIIANVTVVYGYCYFNMEWKWH